MTNSILLFSGGIDSFVAYHYLCYPTTIYFDIHNRYIERELKVVKDLIPETIIEDVLDLSTREEQTAHIPMRNLYFAMLAVKYSDIIYIAGVKDDDVEDKNEDIFLKFSKILTELNDRPINVLSPFWDMTKEQVVEWYLKNIGNTNQLLKTISCYSDIETTNYCGKCTSCFRKYIAFRKNGIEIKFNNIKLIKDYVDKALKGYYKQERNRAILEIYNEDYCS